MINGEGAINVTRTSWFARIETERGYWRPGEEIAAHVQCLTPDLQPTQAEGVITIREITFEGPGNAQIKEEVLRQWKEKTDEEGRISIRLSREKSGLLDISFEAPDHWGGTVEARTVAWVCGPDFNGARYRFNNLEIITDKREYRPGEVAHVMINTARPDSSVIFADEVDQGTLISYPVMRIEKNHTIVDIPVTEEHQPNFYIEAMTVSDMQVYQQALQVCVPPEESAMEVSIHPDKAVYKPGEKARVTVKATTLDGRPLRAGLVMTVFDRALTYIQQETAASITAFFHGRLRSHWTQMTSSLSNTFFHYGGIREPSYVSPAPMEWSWPWTPLGEEWRAGEYAEIDRVMRWQAGGSVSRGDVWKTKESRLGVTASSARDSSVNLFAAPQSVAFSSLEAPATPESAVFPVAYDASPEGAFAEAHTRTRFADTALWTPVVTDEDGTALVEFDMPENLTDWRMRAWGMTEESRTGEGDAGAKTSKNLLVRLQAPRFFMERDEVVLSANIHNYLDSEKRVRASLDIPEDLLAFMEGVEKETDIAVPAGGEARVDWRVRVLKEGEARVRVQALTDEESDAMEMPFPVLVHGILKQETSTGIMRADQTEGSAEIRFSVPEMRRPEQTRLEVRFAPTLVTAMLDALPYCLEYPYGCTEQTMSRFMPAVLTLKTLQNMGVNLEELKQARGRLEEVRRREADQRYTPLLNPVFETEKMREIIREGLSRIEEMRNGDGGWGWWSKDRSSPWLTAYVVYALHTASECDVTVNQDLIESGMNFLMKWEEAELVKPEWRPSTLHADVAHVLSLKGLRAAIKPAEGDTRPPDAVERLHEGRAELNHYGKALLAMALHRLKDQDRAWLVLRNLSQYLEQNEETQTAFLRNPQGGWWHWWNSDIETNAAFLRALVLIQPDHPAAPRLVKWLLNNRKNGYYWRSTRDTALCIAALSDFALAAGETSPDYTLIFDLDNGAVVKRVRVNSDNLFTFDNRFIIEGAALGGGEHTLKITREGTGAVYFTKILQYFTMEEGITAAGHEIKVERTCYLLEKIPAEVAVEDSEGRVITEGRLRYRRILLKDGDTVKSGDL
ncbi:MAG TPA: alpha-2-macroglobulin family protein, partial [Candidatus Sumerlaeota bacterium]|nr:alpha-2-macroglobulin family protein [Candidatus Sumerlaeota bacterium]